jgi:sulfoacetaldehyde acetyltransferase
VLILNDGGYGATRHYQRYNFNEKYVGVNLKNPNFAQVAEAFGARGIRIETPRDLEAHLKDVLSSKRMTVLDIKIDPHEMALPDWIIKSFKD